MCTSTRFPEAIPLRKITAPVIVKALIKFFTLVGLPRSIQSDQGSNFMSGLFQQVMHQLNIQQFRSSAYHPESQGALERFHQTFKTMLKTYCMDNEKDWDEGVPLVLFAYRETMQDSLGYSPFELIFGHNVRGPLKMLKEKWMNDGDTCMYNLLDYVSNFKERLKTACSAASENLKLSQQSMKTWYDRSSRMRRFRAGDKVLVLLPIPGNVLSAKYSGPYVIKRQISDTDYVVQTPDRGKKKRVCHINMLKDYYEREEKSAVLVTTINSTQEDEKEDFNIQTSGSSFKLTNSEILNNLDEKLSHLEPQQRLEVKEIFASFSSVFPDVPSRTSVLHHDVDIGNHIPVKQHPYRVNPRKLEILRSEVNYMLDNDIIEPSQSDWSSPCILVPKPDGSTRFVTDYRKVNLCTTADNYPIPRIDDCIDQVGQAKFISKFDLLKGYWQVPLTESAKRISAFVTPDGLYQYHVMPFGMKNASATFQRLMNKVLQGLPHCHVYIDDIVLSNDTWDEHLENLKALLHRLADAHLTINLAKSEIGEASVTYLGHVVGHGTVRPREAKIEAILQYPTPTDRKSLLRFLGMAGFYRKFCKNFSEIIFPLTSLTSKKNKFVWNQDC